MFYKMALRAIIVKQAPPWHSVECLILRAFSSQNLERHVWRLVQQPEQGPRRAARVALALLPVAHRLNRHANAGGELGLGEARLRADAAGVAGVGLRRPAGLNRRPEDSRISLRWSRRHRPL